MAGIAVELIVEREDGTFNAVFRKDGGRWHEDKESSTLPGFGGQRYMSYLTADDLSNYVRKDFGKRKEIFSVKENENFESLDDDDDYMDDVDGCSYCGGIAGDDDNDCICEE